MNKPSSDFFDRWAGNYDNHLPNFPEYRRLISGMTEEIVKRLEGKKNPKILDIGIGTGIVSSLIHLANSDVHIYGIDISPEMIAKIDRTSFESLDLVISNFEDIDFKEEMFDAIYSNFALHHSQRKQKVLDKINSYLKPDGIFVLGEVVVDIPYHHPEFEYHVTERGGYTARHAMKHSGKRAADLELEVMKLVIDRDGEYLETSEEWVKLIRKAGFRRIRQTVIDSNLGYQMFVASKNGI